MPRIHAKFTTHMKYHMNFWHVSLWCQFIFCFVLYSCEVDSLVYGGLICMWIPFIVTPATAAAAKDIYSPVCVKEESPKYPDLLEETSVQENLVIRWLLELPFGRPSVVYLWFGVNTLAGTATDLIMWVLNFFWRSRSNHLLATDEVGLQFVTAQAFAFRQYVVQTVLYIT